MREGVKKFLDEYFVCLLEKRFNLVSNELLRYA